MKRTMPDYKSQDIKLIFIINYLIFDLFFFFFFFLLLLKEKFIKTY